MTEKIKSKVRICPVSKGYFIEVKDQFSENRLAITKEELEKIVLYGQAILKTTNPN